MLWYIFIFLVLIPIGCAIFSSKRVGKQRPERASAIFIRTLLGVAAFEALIVFGFIYYVLAGLVGLNR